MGCWLVYSERKRIGMHPRRTRAAWLRDNEKEREKIWWQDVVLQEMTPWGRWSNRSTPTHTLCTDMIVSLPPTLLLAPTARMDCVTFWWKILFKESITLVVFSDVDWLPTCGKRKRILPAVSILCRKTESMPRLDSNCEYSWFSNLCHNGCISFDMKA